MHDPSDAPWYIGGGTAATGRLKAILAATLVLAAVFSWTTRYENSFRSLSYPDAADYAQMGRQIYRGEGFTSLQTFPYVLGWLLEHDLPTAPPWPNLHRFPLPPIMAAAAFHVLGVSDFAAILPGGAFFVGTVLIVFLLGNRLYGPLPAMVSSVLVLLSPTQLHYSISGLTEPGTAFFLVAIPLGYSVVAGGERDARLLPFLLGLAIGVGFLQRYNLILLSVPVGLLLLLGPERRGIRVLAFTAAGAFVPFLWWIAVNLSAYGSPLVYLTSDRNLLIGIVRGDVFTSLQQYDPWALVIENIQVPLAKLRKGWLLRSWPGMFGAEFWWLGPAALAGVVTTVRSRSAASVWMFAATALMLVYVAYAITVTVARFYKPFAPLLLIIAVGSATTVLRMLPRKAWSVMPVLALGIIVAAVPPVLDRIDRQPPKRPAAHEDFADIRRLVPEGTVIAAPGSWKVSWYCDRPAIRYRGDLEQLARLDADYTRVGALFFERKQAPDFGRRLKRDRLAKEFVVAQEMRQGSVLWMQRDRAKAVDGPADAQL